jgi:hypothetical protein
LPKEICGLFFGRSANEGAEILIFEEINKLSAYDKEDFSADADKKKRVEKLVAQYDKAFWSALQQVFCKNKNLTNILNLCRFVYENLLEEHASDCADFVGLLSDEVVRSTHFNGQFRLAATTHKAIFSLFSLLKIGLGDGLQEIWERFLRETNSFLDQVFSGKMPQIDENTLIAFLADLAALSGRSHGPQTELNLTIRAWTKVAEASISGQCQPWKFLTVHEGFADDLRAELPRTNVISTSDVVLAAFARKSGYTNWDSVLDYVLTSLAEIHQQAARKGESPRVLDFLYAILPWEENTRSLCERILHEISANAYIAWEDEDSETLFSSLYAFALPDGELWQAANKNSKSLRLIDWWKTSADNKVAKVLELAQRVGELDFVWQRMKEPSNLLAREVILAALKNQACDLFDPKESAAQILTLLGQVHQGKRAAIIQQYLSIVGGDKDRLFDERLLNLEKYPAEILSLMMYLESESLETLIAPKLNAIELSSWNKALDARFQQSDPRASVLKIVFPATNY